MGSEWRFRRCRWGGSAKTLLWVALLVAGCGGRPAPGPIIDRSPLAAPSARLYLPLAGRAPAAKLGLAGGSPELVRTLGGSWYYWWHGEPHGAAGIEAVGMIWGRWSGGVPQVTTGSRWLLGFNEPDALGQAYLPPQEAAALWRQIEAVYPERLLVSPAPSHLHPEWLPAFREAYRELYGAYPRMDALALHCYLPTAAECIALGQQYVAWAEEWDAAEVWCTEFAFLPAWSADAAGEARGFVAWLEAEPRVTRYAPYVSYETGGTPWWPAIAPGTNPSLFDAAGRLTEIGLWYARVR